MLAYNSEAIVLNDGLAGLVKEIIETTVPIILPALGGE
jgi:hypothetical protein